MAQFSSLNAVPKIGLIDIGSNTIRLVIFKGLTRVPTIFFNESVMCGLGRDMKDGYISTRAQECALINLKRFSTLARAHQVESLTCLATEAVRHAINGPAFIKKVEKTCRTPVTVLTGEQEAFYSAQGVVSALPYSCGVVADLGGGSLELAALKEGHVVGQISLAIGPLRLLSASVSIEKFDLAFELSKVNWLKDYINQSLYLVGGASRAIGKICIDEASLPLDSIHGLVLDPALFKKVCAHVSGLSAADLSSYPSRVRKRRDVLPWAAKILGGLADHLQSKAITFSGFGLREGYLLYQLPLEERSQDPFLWKCAQLETALARVPSSGEAAFTWTVPLFEKESPAQARLRKGICLLSDIVWDDHPDYRGEHGFLKALRLPEVGLTHRERAFIALSVYRRYEPKKETALLALTEQLLSPAEIEVALKIGLSLRLAQALKTGLPSLLEVTSLKLSSKTLTLKVDQKYKALVGDVVIERLKALGKVYQKDISIL